MEFEVMVPRVQDFEAEAARAVLRDSKDPNARLVASAILQLDERLETTLRHIAEIMQNYDLCPKSPSQSPDLPPEFFE